MHSEQLLPSELWERIVLWSPEISMHVLLSAVCRGWRNCLARRTALSVLPSQTRDSEDSRGPALIDVLSRCAALDSLVMSWDPLSYDFFEKLAYLECAKTLRALTIVQLDSTKLLPYFAIAQVLAALPALETLDASVYCFIVDAPTDLRHGVRALPLLCRGPALPPRAVWASGLSALRRLTVGLPDDAALCSTLLTDLRAAVPRLETLNISGNIDEAGLVALLDEAAHSLRELVVSNPLSVSKAFAPWVERNLAGLEAVDLFVDPGNFALSAIACILGLPRLREAVVECIPDQIEASAVMRLSWPSGLERLSLSYVPYPVSIALPSLRSLTYVMKSMGDVVSTVDCPALEELTTNQALAIRCSDRPTQHIRVAPTINLELSVAVPRLLHLDASVFTLGIGDLLAQFPTLRDLDLDLDPKLNAETMRLKSV